MDEIIAREATANDLPTLYRFEQGVINAERPFIPKLQEGDINYYDLQYMLTAKHIHLVVAETNGLLIGSGYARIEEARHYLKHKYHAYLGFMYVEPAYRGRGVNKLVLDALMKWAHEQHIDEAVLEVYNDNEPAIKAYEKSGFSRYMINMRKSILPNQ
jgi:ribosomal protein S18 acetylase RimI-like enzyme